MAQNFPEFRRLLLAAIGSDRQKKDFAEQAGLSPSHLSRLLNDEVISRPSYATLEKVADASCGRVTLQMLLSACGWSDKGKTAPETPYPAFRDIGDPDVQRTIMEFKKGMSVYGCTATRHESLEDILDTVAALFARKKLSFVIDKKGRFTGRGHYNAEEYANLTASWATDAYSCSFGCVLYYCETRGGGVILSDTSFDLISMVNTEHPLGQRKLKALTNAEKPNLIDYQTVFFYEKH